jgi:hypothetical protein
MTKSALRSVTQLLFRDREKVRHIQGAQLTRTSLVSADARSLANAQGNCRNGRRSATSLCKRTSSCAVSKISTSLCFSVEHGQIIDAKSAVATTQVLTKTSARVQLSKTDERRILLITEEQQSHQKIKGTCPLKENDLIQTR